MARFVLVHGAFTGAWIWGPLAERLRSAGHAVEVFDLPGLGDDATLPEDVTLDSCAARLGEVLTAGAEPAILVGNSMGGVIATQAAARYPDSVAALIYATAFVPRDGQSLLDLTRLPEGAEDQVQANIVIEPPWARCRQPRRGARCMVPVPKPMQPGRFPSSGRNRLGRLPSQFRSQAERWTVSTATSSFARKIGRYLPRCSVG